MKIDRTENYHDCVLLGKASMSAYFQENGIPWDLDARLETYSNLEVYEVSDGELKGYIAIREAEGRFYLADIQIFERFQNQGYGTGILKFAKQMAKTRGYAAVFLKVFKTSPALNLYLRNGYGHFLEETHVYVLRTST